MNPPTQRTAPPWRWPAEAIWEAVAPLLPGFSVEVLPRIDSTNTELMRRARAGRCEPLLLVAERQTAGRGRLGRSWHSAGPQPAAAGQGEADADGEAEGEGECTGLPALTFSLGLPLAPADWSGLSLAVGVSVAESLQPQLPAPGSRTPRVGLKWPNDLWLEGGGAGAGASGTASTAAGPGPYRKLGGILVETASMLGQSPGTATSAAQRYVVVGVGLNVHPPALDPALALSVPPGSLQELAGGSGEGGGETALDAPAALLRVAAPLVAMLQAFEGYGFEPMQPRFDRRDVLRGRSVQLSDGSSGTAHGVGADGALLVLTAAGTLQAVTSSDISVRPAGPAPALPGR